MSELVLKYDPLTIKHLGVSLYSQLPSVLSELVSNAYDADAENITIELNETPNKEIHVKDDGDGMSFDELNDKYLLIGRNRRIATGCQKTNKGRFVIGKKGLGKLSVFGVCKEIEVRTVKGNILNHFIMNLDDIEKSKGSYNPKMLYKNTCIDEPSGTLIILKQIKRKTPFNIDSLCDSLAKKFTILDELKVSVVLEEDRQVLTNERKFEKLDIQFTWDLPDSRFGTDYQFWDKIKGRIITPKTPLRDTQMKGIYLSSRGKTVNEPEFYGARDNDQVHTYMTGYLAVDFIDDFESDIISTDRHSLIWETDEANSLRNYIQKIIRKVGGEWKKKRIDINSKNIKVSNSKSLDEWKKSIPCHERDLANKIIDPIISNPNLNDDDSEKLVQNVVSKFDNQSYKNYIAQLVDISDEAAIPELVKLLDDWKITEMKQLSDLAEARVGVIKKFEELLDQNTKEVPTLHNFLKEFSWLLDPRILEFKDEVRYSTILKENYPEEGLEEKDRRIDFLCSNALGNVLYVIEIKRSKYAIDEKSIEQAYDYGSFLKEKYASESGFSNVVSYIVGGSKASDRKTRAKEQTYSRTGEVFVKTYAELLEQSKEYHKEFIEAYNSRSMS